MKKYTCIFAALVALAFTFANTAHAEWVFGGQYGPSKVELTGAGTLTGSLDESGTELGVFVQGRGDVLGLHIGVGTNSTEIEGSITTAQKVFNFKTAMGLTYDLLGMLVLEGEKINGIGMFGLSVIKSDTAGDLFGSVTASGWKFAGGIEVPFANGGGVVQFTYEHADLGEHPISGTNAKIEFEQSGFRLRIGTRF